MSHIPLIFTRPFQSIHFSVGNIAHTCLYVSLYPLLCSVDRHFQPSPFAFPPRESWKGEPVVVATRPCLSRTATASFLFRGRNDWTRSSVGGCCSKNVIVTPCPVHLHLINLVYCTGQCLAACHGSPRADPSTKVTR